MTNARVILTICLAVVPALLFPGDSLSGEKVLPDRRYSIHTASYANSDGARREVQMWKAAGYAAFVRKVDLAGSGTWHRVYVGRFPTREDGARVARKLKKEGLLLLDTFVLVSMKLEDADPAAAQAAASPPVQRNEMGKQKPPAADWKKKQRPAAGHAKEARQVRGAPASADGNPGPDIVRKSGKPVPAAKTSKSAGDIEQPPAPKDPVMPRPPKVPTAAAGDGSSVADAGEGEREPDSPGLSPEATPPALAPAMEKFRAGRYEEAIAGFGEVLKGQSAEPGLKETALLYSAHSFYLLGGRGDRQKYLEAVEQYKAVLAIEGKSDANDLVYYRLGSAYEKLKFYYEASAAFANLAVKYPASPLRQEAQFRSARMLHRAGKYQQAAERLIAYLLKQPNGKNAKIAYFTVADCYYRLQQTVNAELWYGEGRKKWPDLRGVPPDLLLNMGYHYYVARKYQQAIPVLCRYLSLYPREGSVPGAIVTLGNCYAQNGQIPSALNLFSLVVERYDGTLDAQEAAILMADLGVARPGIKISSVMPGIANYEDPVSAYEAILRKNADFPMVEELLYKKSLALAKFGRHQESISGYIGLLDRYPYGRHSEEGRRGLAAAAGPLVKAYASKGDHLAVADLYLRTANKGAGSFYDRENLLLIGRSLKKAGLNDLALQALQDLEKSDRNSADERRRIGALSELETWRNGEDGKKLLSELLRKRTAGDASVPREVKKAFAERFYREGDYPKAALLYAEASAGPGEADQDLPSLGRFADSLRRTGSTTAAVGQYQKVLSACTGGQKPCEAKFLADIYEGLGDCHLRSGNDSEGIRMFQQAMAADADRERRSWALYRIGQAQARSGGGKAAEKWIAPLRESAEDGFWAKVADYWTVDRKWPGARAASIKN